MPKGHKRLAMCNLKAMKQVGRMNFAWNFKHHKGKLWVNVLRAKYGRDQLQLHNIEVKVIDSPIWKSIAKVWPMLRCGKLEMGELLVCGTINGWIVIFVWGANTSQMWIIWLRWNLVIWMMTMVNGIGLSCSTFFLLPWSRGSKLSFIHLLRKVLMLESDLVKARIGDLYGECLKNVNGSPLTSYDNEWKLI